MVSPNSWICLSNGRSFLLSKVARWLWFVLGCGCAVVSGGAAGCVTGCGVTGCWVTGCWVTGCCATDGLVSGAWRVFFADVGFCSWTCCPCCMSVLDLFFFFFFALGRGMGPLTDGGLSSRVDGTSRESCCLVVAVAVAVGVGRRLSRECVK